LQYFFVDPFRLNSTINYETPKINQKSNRMNTHNVIRIW